MFRPSPSSWMAMSICHYPCRLHQLLSVGCKLVCNNPLINLRKGAPDVLCYLQWQNHVLKSHHRQLPHGASTSSCSTFHHGEQGTNISLQHRGTHTGLTCKNLPLHDWGYICPRTASAPCFLSLVKWILRRTQLVCSQSSQPDIYERSFSQFVICNERSLIRYNLHIPWNYIHW
jgi:hypothetical protein